jgi:hypothetical protein
MRGDVNTIRRTGLGLIEVLAAVFILGVGLIALLTLFPLGVQRMGQAFRDNRSTECANAADGVMRTLWKAEVVESNQPTELFFHAMSYPDFLIPPPPPPGTAVPFPHPVNVPQGMPPTTTFKDLLVSGEPGYPVFVDGMGYAARNGLSSQYWVGDPGTTNLPRRTLNAATDPARAQRLFSALDGLYYDDFGKPTGERDMRYNFAYLLRQPNASNPKVCEMTVIVYDNRAHLYVRPNSEVVLRTNARPGLTSLTFQLGSNDISSIKAGTWLMDATVNPTPQRARLRHAFFYRVVAVNEATGELELQTPIKPPSDNFDVKNYYPATFVVLHGVSGVFVRPNLTE